MGPLQGHPFDRGMSLPPPSRFVLVDDLYSVTPSLLSIDLRPSDLVLLSSCPPCDRPLEAFVIEHLFSARCSRFTHHVSETIHRCLL